MAPTNGGSNGSATTYARHAAAPTNGGGGGGWTDAEPSYENANGGPGTGARSWADAEPSYENGAGSGGRGRGPSGRQGRGGLGAGGFDPASPGGPVGDGMGAAGAGAGGLGGGGQAPRHRAPDRPPPEPIEPITLRDPSAGIDAETRLWNAQYFRDRLTSEIDSSRRRNSAFSVVMIQVADEPFQPLPYRRQVALLRELGHQFVPRFFDHLVHLPDGAQHWFAVVLADTDRTTAQAHERRLRTTIAGYLRSRGLRVGDVQSASLTSPDDDEAMAAVWSSLLGADPHTADA
jgi:hypothetical protein